ncbi:MAG: L,D-transpeptidase family protein [Proteobacteria bacterium]|nr:L,D-transpeptidase family protein [Pseudomonadota bacterium]
MVNDFLLAVPMFQPVKNKRKFRKRILAACFILTLGLPVFSYAQYQGQGSDTVGKSILAPLLTPAVMQGALGKGAIDGIEFTDAKAIKAFYGGRENVPFWLNGRGERERVESVLNILENSWTHGLNPKEYHAAQIRELLESDSLFKPKQARLELLLTDAVMRYGHDITGMRVDPASIKQQSKFWRAPLTPAEMLEKISASDDPAEDMEELAPQDKFYEALREELARMMTVENDYDQYLPIDFGGGLFNPGGRHRNVAKLRGRMGLDHRESDGPPSFYDDRLAAAVMKFQKQHGLDPDGVIGSKTLALLNRTNKGQIEQIVANMERLRWLEQEKPDRYILINLPSQMLWAVENGKTVHEMKVVVGMPWRKTRDFTTMVTGVRLNPTWTVPYGIKMADMLPKLKEDPYALTDKGIEFYRGYGKGAPTFDPGTVNWKTVSRAEMLKIKMMQTPGDHNALGRVRILMDNEFDMYMHDTNHPEFFDLEDRTKSSGCIRLHDPRKIADFVMSGSKGWSKNKMEEIIASGGTTDMNAAKPFPVFILYQTMWQDDKGQLVYGPDIYERDETLIKALKAQKHYWMPAAEDVREAYDDMKSKSSRLASYN